MCKRRRRRGLFLKTPKLPGFMKEQQVATRVRNTEFPFLGYLKKSEGSIWHLNNADLFLFSFLAVCTYQCIHRLVFGKVAYGRLTEKEKGKEGKRKIRAIVVALVKFHGISEKKAQHYFKDIFGYQWLLVMLAIFIEGFFLMKPFY